MNSLCQRANGRDAPKFATHQVFRMARAILGSATRYSTNFFLVTMTRCFPSESLDKSLYARLSALQYRDMDTYERSKNGRADDQMMYSRSPCTTSSSTRSTHTQTGSQTTSTPNTIYRQTFPTRLSEDSKTACLFLRSGARSVNPLLPSGVLEAWAAREMKPQALSSSRSPSFRLISRPLLYNGGIVPAEP